jgi:hypothetical protein
MSPCGAPGCEDALALLLAQIAFVLLVGRDNTDIPMCAPMR